MYQNPGSPWYPYDSQGERDYYQRGTLGQMGTGITSPYNQKEVIKYVTLPTMPMYSLESIENTTKDPQKVNKLKLLLL